MKRFHVHMAVEKLEASIRLFIRRSLGRSRRCGSLTIDESTNQADQVWKAVVIMRQQLKRLDARLSGLDRAAAAAKESLARPTLSLADYARLDSNALTARV